MIVDWLEKLFGIKPVPYGEGGEKAEKRDLSQVSIRDGHFDDTLAALIASMFCNPNKWDRRWLETMGDPPLLKWIKRMRIRWEYSRWHDRQV